MEKDRLLAFSDGVIAVIITIMVLELKAPHDPSPAALLSMAPDFLSYVLSFTYVAIYWNNHHHMLYVTERINGGILWANLALLFFLSLVPVSTAWLGNTHGALWPTVVYGVTLLCPGVAYYVLQNLIVREQGRDSLIAKALGEDWKGNLSPILYIVGIGLAF